MMTTNTSVKSIEIQKLFDQITNQNLENILSRILNVNQNTLLNSIQNDVKNAGTNLDYFMNGLQDRYNIDIDIIEDWLDENDIETPAMKEKRRLYEAAKEQKRLETDLEKLTKVAQGLRKKLGNENFVKRAPEEILVETKTKLEKFENQMKQIELNLEALQ